MPTTALLQFQLDHARARDAVHDAMDSEALAARIAPLPTVTVRSKACDRATYIRNPDLGRQLAREDQTRLEAEARPEGWDVVFIIGDGLSARAVAEQAPQVLHACVSRLNELSIAPVVLAQQSRVALGDEIASALGARMGVVLLGERPGLSVPASLGAYLTWSPKRGRCDAERNCVSNIHADGLTADIAAEKICWLVREGLRRGFTGVELKEMSADPEALLRLSIDDKGDRVREFEPHSTQTDPWPQQIT